jgi:hypothetical protein
MKALAFLALLVAAGCGADAAREPAGSAPVWTAGEGEAAAVWSAMPSGWSELPPPPLVRHERAAVWTGDELVIWGGNTNNDAVEHADGAVYLPAAREWRLLPPAPLSGRSSPAAVWTGSELIIWGGGHYGHGNGAALDPATRKWRLLADSPLDPREPVAAVWTGTEMIVWGDQSRGAAKVDGAAYAPKSDSWRTLAPAPLALNEATAVWTGEEMIVYGALLDGHNRAPTEHAQGIAYDPEKDSWRILAPFPLSPQASIIVWTGGEIVAWDYDLEAGAYDPAADGWRPLRDPPFDESECYPESAHAGVVVAWFCGATVAELKGPRGAWETVTAPRSLTGGALSAGEVVLFVGPDRLWAYKPA